MTNQDLVSFYRPPSWSTGHISLEDAQFLDQMVRKTKPAEIVEVGVASGCSSAVLLRSLNLLGGNRTLYSFDLLDHCYFAPERGVGAAACELAPQFIHLWSLHPGRTAVDAGQSLKGCHIGMAFIDADHRHPWASLDLYALLPALAVDGWIILHDITLAHTTHWQVFGPEILFTSWPGEKMKAPGRGNIGAIKLSGDHDTSRHWLAIAMNQTWETDVDEELLDHLSVPMKSRAGSLYFHRLPQPLNERLKTYSSQGREILIWGAGSAGNDCLAELLNNGIEPNAFIDSDERKHGQCVQAISIVPISYLQQRTRRPFVIVASMYSGEIIRELNAMGYSGSQDFVCFAPSLPAAKFKKSKPIQKTGLLGMTTTEEQSYLLHYARDLFTGSGAIVDLGSWLGSTVIPLAHGLQAHAASHHTVQAYDMFLWQDWMERHAGELKGRFMAGDSFLAEFFRRLGSLAPLVRTHAADLTQIGWNGGPIEFLQIDAMKSWQLCTTINRNFLPSLLPDHGLVMHQDFKFWGCPWIHLSMFRMRDFFQIAHDLPNSPGTIFRLTRPLDDETLTTASVVDKTSLKEIDEAYAYWKQRLTGPLTHLIDCGKVLLLEQIGARAEAFAEFERLLYSDIDLHEHFLDVIRRLYPEKKLPLPAEPWRESAQRAVNENRPIWIWGASQGGRNFLQTTPWLRQLTENVLDSDLEKTGLTLEGIPIVRPEALPTGTTRPFVIVTTSFVAEVTARLREVGYTRGRDYCVADLS